MRNKYDSVHKHYRIKYSQARSITAHIYAASAAYTFSGS